MNKAQVIIVGGGAAGIAAGTRLVQNGFQNVTILEAEDRLGGRCNTITLGDEHIDLGAQWIHGETNNVVYEMAAPKNLTKDSLFDMTSFHFNLPNGEPMNPTVSEKLYEYCRKTLNCVLDEELSPNRALSLGKVFMKSFNENLKELEDLNLSDQEIHQFLEWFQQFQNSFTSSDSWYDNSLEGVKKFKDCDGNQHLAWKTGGYSNIIDLLQKVPTETPLNVLYGKQVTQITRNHKIEVQCADGSVFTTDHVIVCVSLGVLKHNGQLKFSPPLPAKKLTAIDTIAIGVAEKLFVQFPDRWWPKDKVMLNVLLDTHAREDLDSIGKRWLVGIIGFFVLDNAPNTLCAWVGGFAARYISKLSDDVLRGDLHFFLKRYMSDKIPVPTRFARSNWFGNPYFRGAYSFLTVRASIARASSEDLAEPVLDKLKPVLMFAGEATHPHFFSTVHGAIETGWREADRLLSYYKHVPLNFIQI